MPQKQAIHEAFRLLKEKIQGDVRTDKTSRMLYASDASIYQVEPDGVVLPKTTEDILCVLRIAGEHGLPVIPRAGGTSLSGQCVGKGIIMDISKSMTQMLAKNPEERSVWVQPGMIQDELSRLVKGHGLMFGPDTSTSNRAMIGGMIGNNSCGSHSIYYGKTVDHTLEMEVVLSDGSLAVFRDLTPEELEAKKKLTTLEGHIYREVTRIVETNHAEIEARYPKIVRRNNGYLLDEFLDPKRPFNLSRLICASEGSLAVITKAKMNLVPIPKLKGLMAIQFNDLYEALQATVTALPLKPAAVELIDRTILDLCKDNRSVQHLRFFLDGSPDAILAVEFYGEEKKELEDRMDKLEAALKKDGLGYAYPRLWDNDINKVWDLRKAGLGVLSTMPGDGKPATFVEDTAVAPEKLPAYIRDFRKIVDKYETTCVYYAHASVGELHLRPVLNLKDRGDLEKMKRIAEEVADLVIRYGGAISGEHGDGRIRGPFNEKFFGPVVYQALRQVKAAFDPKNILNPGKIVDALPIDTDLRYPEGYRTYEIPTTLSFEQQQGYVRAIEFCNGAGACRKNPQAKGTMCPSYQATLEEQHSTRGRANVLRIAMQEFGPVEAFKRPEVYDTMNLCLECKACKSECPSSVDMAKIKYEYLQRRWDLLGTPLSAYAFGYINVLNRILRPFAPLYNAVMKLPFASWWMEKLLHVSRKRRIPALAAKTVDRWFLSHKPHKNAGRNGKTLLFFADPFVNYNEPEIGKAAITVLEALGYQIRLAPIHDDGRTLISKGLIRKAQALAKKNLDDLKPILLAEGLPMVGIEPSTLLTFRDEYLDFFPKDPDAAAIAKKCFLIDEFLVAESKTGAFQPINAFRSHSQTYLVHGHCMQKALAKVDATLKMLELVPGIKAKEIPSGCCGMAGSFGYDKDKYDVSMKIGEMILFPAVRQRADAEILAVGTSCRHQIYDGVEYSAKHPIQILMEALAAPELIEEEEEE